MEKCVKELVEALKKTPGGNSNLLMMLEFIRANDSVRIGESESKSRTTDIIRVVVEQLLLNPSAPVSP